MSTYFFLTENQLFLSQVIDTNDVDILYRPIFERAKYLQIDTGDHISPKLGQYRPVGTIQAYF